MKEEINLQNLPHQLDESLRSRAAIGLVVLATDHVIENEFQKILNLQGVALYQSRIFNEPSVNTETLSAMESRLENSVKLILPGMPLDVVAFGCTSASMVIGPSRIHEICQKAKPGVRVTNPFTAAIEALRTMEVSRIALLTPYRDDLNQQMRSNFEKEGIQVPAMASFNVEDDNRVGRIAPASIEAVALEIGMHSSVDGVFVACTNLRIAERVHFLEQKLGKPLTSSNHAMAWHTLSLAGISHSQAGWGRLFERMP
ncbi:MAG: Asp/Glu racemase [Deltaproteobacteria bacterium]|nr:Asp/Glu racemase [Deltaproteobacteria bacterium]